MAEASAQEPEGTEAGSRRDFLYLLTGATAAVGAGVTLWPLIDTMNPAADVLALASIRVDISGVEEGMSITVQWRGTPVFIRHRTAEEIEAAQAVDLGVLPDPEPDEARVLEPQWLIMVGVCTHLGCIPLGQAQGDPRGDYNGWFCPCHGSHYDTSGRIRRGPAPSNLVVPEYEFVEDNVIQIG